MSEIEQIILYQQINESLIKQFMKQCPPFPENTIIRDKNIILMEFQKWYDFWDSKDPIIKDLNINNRKTMLLLIKKKVCSNRKVTLLKELKSIGLHKEFIENNMRRNVI